jgi:hypothetical protein
MNARALQGLTLVLGLALAGTTAACTCARIEDDKAFFDALFAGADSIVHAKIIGLATKHEARVEIIESFKGHPTTLKTQPGDGTSCATKFQIGEEAVFVSYLGQVGPCGRMPVSRELIEGLRAYKRSSQSNHTVEGDAGHSCGARSNSPACAVL